MNIRLFPNRLKKPFARWSTAEDARMVEMRKSGATLRQIADDINRPIETISVRLRKKHGIYKHKPRYARLPIRAAITFDQVPSYYELGWRFVGFDGELLVFEWGGRGDARYPYSLRNGCPNDAMVEPERAAA